MGYNAKNLDFKIEKNENGQDVPFYLEKINIPKIDYVLDFFEKNINQINQFNIVALFSKKDMGKSFVGYLGLKDFFKKKIGNAVYGRIQEKEKKAANPQLREIMSKLGLDINNKGKNASDYIRFKKDKNYLRLINLSSYQSVRGAIGDDVRFIGFDEINAYKFPQNFESDFINILSTLGRHNDFKLFLSGNNETAINNPILNCLQLKFDGNYSGLQLATREISGVKILGIQMGKDCFNNKNPSIAEKIAKNNPTVYKVFYEGQSITNNDNCVLNLKEDYQTDRLLYYGAECDNIFSVGRGKIEDKINNVIRDNVIIVSNEVVNYNSNDFNRAIRLLTASPESNMLFKTANLVQDEELNELVKLGSLSIKNQQMYFTDFVSKESFFNLIKKQNFAKYERVLKNGK